MGLYCGIDLHSNNAVYVVADEQDKPVFKKRLPNDLEVVLRALEPYREELEAVAVESTYNWYWLVDGLQEHEYPVRLANPAAIVQFEGLKDADDETDALFLAQLCRLDILPEGYIYPKEERSARDLLRRRMLLVQQRTAIILSLRNMFARENGSAPGWRHIARMTSEELTKLTGADECLLFVAKQQIDLIHFFCQRIGLFEKQGLKMMELRPEYETLLTMPGIGKILGLTIMLETGDINRFAKVGNYTSYCRCARAKHWSNGKKKADNNRKNGNKYLSWAFVEAVHHAIRYCPPAKKWYQRKMAQKNGALATKALASKWAKAAYYILKDQKPFDIGRVFG
ncbi:MAG: IS110 family transposase [Planctomycetota bacterium]|nr:IS110 family transposase [Planctomycetota bacterium]